jgi:hypothetical protein
MKILNEIACTLFWMWIEYQIELNSIQIQLKRNGMQIGGEGFQTCLWMWCWRTKTLKILRSKNTPFHASLLENGLDRFWAENW